MSKLFERLDSRKAKDLRVLADFVAIFCRENHPAEAKALFPIRDERLSQVLANQALMLCPECTRLLNHGTAKLMLCTQDPKPMCKKCPTHCYAPGYRERIREVMKFSGLYLVKHGRLDLIFHYFF